MGRHKEEAETAERDRVKPISQLGKDGNCTADATVLIETSMVLHTCMHINTYTCLYTQTHILAKCLRAQSHKKGITMKM